MRHMKWKRRALTRDSVIVLLTTCPCRLSIKLSIEMALGLASSIPFQTQHSIHAYSRLPGICEGSDNARSVNARNATSMPCAMQSKKHYHMFTPFLQSRNNTTHSMQPEERR